MYVFVKTKSMYLWTYRFRRIKGDIARDVPLVESKLPRPRIKMKAWKSKGREKIYMFFLRGGIFSNSFPTAFPGFTSDKMGNINERRKSISRENYLLDCLKKILKYA